MTSTIAAGVNATPRSHHPLARSVAGYGLEGFGAEAPPSAPGPDWRMLAAELVDQRLTGLAVAAAQEGWLPLEDDQAADLLERHRGAMLWVLSIERTLVALDEAFNEAGIDYLVLKGPALARTFYPDPSLRAFGDLDLLIRGSDWERACTLLPALGFTRQHPESRPGFVDSFGKAAVHTDGTGLELDLHRRLVVGRYGLAVDTDELFENPAWCRVGARWVRTLDDGLMFVHACMHAALGHRNPRLLPLRDVLQVAASDGIDWDAVAERVERWSLKAVVGHAVPTAAALLGARPAHEAASLAASLAPSRRERRWLDAYTTGRRGRGGTALGTLSAIPSVRGKSAYAAALLFPSREFVEARTRSRGFASYLARWKVPLRWLSGRSGFGRQRP
ncbi:MAG: nucleotidyltransferase domain-containing protein [Actinomycetota bacterium]